MKVTDAQELKTRPWFHAYPERIKRRFDDYQFPRVSLFDFLKSSAKYYGDSTAVLYENENLLLNYKELLSLCGRFAEGLVNKLGLSKGDTIAIYARNYPEVIIGMFASYAAGATYVSCNPILIKEELKYQLVDSKAKVAIISDDKYPVLKEILDEGGTMLEAVIVFDRDHELKLDLFEQGREQYKEPFVAFKEVFGGTELAPVKLDPSEDLAAIIYTSGTTGQPKGVMVSHENAVCSAILYHATYTGMYPEEDEEGLLKFENDPADLQEDWDFPIRYGIDSAMAAAPWTHMMGFLAHLQALVMGAMAIIPVPEMNIKKAFEIIKRWKVSFAGGAPQMMTMMLESPDIDETDLSSIRVWTTGGAPCTVALGTNFEQKIGGVIAEGYSLTEATMASVKNFSNKSSQRKWGSIGLPLPFTDVKIVNPGDRTQEMAPGEEGELIHNGYQVSKGYLNLPEETAECFEDGWIFTGDIGRMDEDGYFYITGRLKDIIIYKGYNIAPRMLEEVLYAHPQISEAAVVGQKDERAGEIPVAFVVLKDGADLGGKEIIEYVNERVAGYKKIRKAIVVNELPYSGTGKIMKKNLATMLEGGKFLGSEVAL
ncbi:MAG: acyl--CoA ligase [Deltaproteobacteria bacterium]|nr:acyl--CoA ligase [Deltaproteobacteria bacterium]